MFQNSPIGTYITTFSAKDPDKGLNQLVSYYIIAGNELGDLYLDESTGVLTTSALLDYERVPSYNVRFRSSHQRCSVKKVFLEISENLQENTCARVSFLIKLQS